MTANKPTPGPWGTDESDHDCTYQDIRIRSDGHTIAVVHIDDAPCTDFNARQRANARLIAAAPELLELARELWTDVRHNSEEDEPFGQRVRAVIVKATGETP